MPYYCDESTPCLPRYSDRPFCDLYGTYDASSHVGRTCIPNPLDGSVGIDAAVDVDSGMPPADGGTDAAPNAPDAGTPDAGNPDAQTGPCDPVTQTGCASGEKCTFIIDTSDPTNNHTGCAPNGTVAAGAACTRDANGVDDCLRPYFCSGGVCTEICSTNPESCPSTATCTPFAGLFDDRTDVGLCVPQCDPLSSTSCGTGEGCYLSLLNGTATCAVAYLDDPEAKTGAATCVANPGTQSCNCVHLNGCVAGYGCVLQNDPTNPTSNVCAFYCDPTQGGAGPSCSAAIGGGSTFSCRQIMSFYGNASVDPAIGMCIDSTLWAGHCEGCVDPTQPGCGSCP